MKRTLVMFVCFLLSMFKLLLYFHDTCAKTTRDCVTKSDAIVEGTNHTDTKQITYSGTAGIRSVTV